MRGIAPEVDRLMWAVAENPEVGAIAEFGARYPELRAELMHRVNMVRSLRNEVRPSPRNTVERPRFEHRDVRTRANPRAVAFAGTLAFAALAAASYTAYTLFHPEPVKTAHVRVDPAPANLGPLTVRERPPVAVPTPKETSPPARDNESPEDAMQAPPLPSYLRPRDRVAFKDEKLTTALALVTEGTGIHLELGPGFVDRSITVDYRGKNTVEILKDLANQYAFTVFDEGSGTFLVLPVQDRRVPQEPVPATPDPARAGVRVKGSEKGD
jgi:hypothetical protein